MLSRAKEQLSALDAKIMSKVDEKIDAAAAAAARLRKQQEQPSPIASPATPAAKGKGKDGSGRKSSINGTPNSSSSQKSATPLSATASSQPQSVSAGLAAPAAAFDAAAAAKAFATVPKEELVGLLHKTNARCKTLETRYAELKRLHEQLLEEKRTLVATRGRAGRDAEAEREQIETTLRQGYEDRLQELEEQAGASQAIKKQLQLELESASTQVRAATSARASGRG